jgi:hypothetical protein
MVYVAKQSAHLSQRPLEASQSNSDITTRLSSERGYRQYIIHSAISQEVMKIKILVNPPLTDFPINYFSDKLGGGFWGHIRVTLHTQIGYPAPRSGYPAMQGNYNVI